MQILGNKTGRFFIIVNPSKGMGDKADYFETELN